MNIVRIFDQTRYEDDVIGTEKQCIELLKTENLFLDSIILADHWFAQQINAEGVSAAQNAIDTYCKHFDGYKIVFICHHIAVKKLNWRDNIVFSPHAELGHPAKPIPHYAVNHGSIFLNINERDLIGSFVGTYSTHPCRMTLAHYFENHEGYYFNNTQNWHFEYSTSEQLIRKVAYKKFLENSKFSFSPRGTGPSTIRIWEALASGSIPIIISNSLILPHPFNLLLPVYNQDHIRYLPEIISSHLNKNEFLLEETRKRLTKAYYQYGANDKLHYSILNTLRR